MRKTSFQLLIMLFLIHGYFSPSQAQQLGGGTGGFFGGQSLAGPMGMHRQVSSNDVIITWPENNDELRGFSSSLGEWETLPIEKQEEVIPMVGSTVAAVRVGNSMAAYSSVKGWWDVLRLSPGSSAHPIMSSDLVTVEDNEHLYTFSSAKGRWTSPTDPEYRASSVSVNVGASGSIDLKSIIDAWFESLPKYKARAASVNVSRGVAVIQSDRLSLLNEIKATIEAHRGAFATELNGAEADPNTATRSIAKPVPDRDQMAELEPRLSQLRDELDELERTVTASTTASNSQESKVEQRDRLRKLVEKTFDTRQRLQTLEAQRMQLKLRSIEANLEARLQSRQAIIDQRVEQLESSLMSIQRF